MQRKMRRFQPLIYVMATTAILPITVTRAQDMSLGGTGTASAMSAGMSGQSGAGTMAVGSRAAGDARALGNSPMMGGMGAPDAMGAGDPMMPNPTGAGGMAGMGGAGGGAAAAAPVRREPLRWGKETGEDFLRELKRTPTRGKVRRSRAGRRGRRVSNQRLSRLPRKTRSRVIASRYQKPPVGYLSFYLPQDRYKLTSRLWKFVTIEDDRARYPVKYYYQPNSPVFLSILGRQPRNSQPRYNRVLGFASWQDAMIAGYRPDPVSKPTPGAELANLRSIAPREDLVHYTEFVYAGQITPNAFAQNYKYIQTVRGIANRRSDTRRLLPGTVGQILRAALGEGPAPTQIGVTRRAVIQTQTTSSSGMMGASPAMGSSVTPSSPSSMEEPREAGYSNFRNNAGNLSSTR